MAEWKMENAGIITTMKDGVATMRVDRPDLKNGTDSPALLAMAEAYERIAEDESVRVLVYRGTGDYFFTGGRVDATDPEDSRRYAVSQEKCGEARERLHIPIIAAINGDCFKGGMGMLMDADMAVAKKTAKFSFPEVRMGGVPMIVTAQCVRMPKKLLMEMLYSSEEVDAETMYRMGLLNEITTEEGFDEAVDRYVHKIIDYPKKLIEMTRRFYYDMAAIQDDKERMRFAEKNLAEVVLPQMAKEKQEYNI